MRTRDILPDFRNENTIKIVFLFLVIAVIAVMIISFSSCLQKFYTLDEAEMVKVSEKVVEIGPKTYLPKPDGWGAEVSHPPLYDFTIAGVIKLLGAGEVVLRGFLFIFHLFAILFLVLISKSIFKRDNVEFIFAPVLVVLLYIVNPIVIQHSVLIDGDSSIFLCLLLLFIYLFIKFEKYEGKAFILSRLSLALVLAISFMIKELTPTLLCVSLLLYRIINRDFKRFLADLFITILGGVIIFWVVWFIYCYFTGIDCFGFLKFNVKNKGAKVLTFKYLINIIKIAPVIAKWPFYWPSAPFSLLVFAALYYKIKDIVKSKFKFSEPEDFVFLSSVVMFFPYQLVKPSIEMMKYQYPVYPIFMIIISWLVIRHIFEAIELKHEMKRKSINLFYAAILVIVFAALYYYKIGDYIIDLWGALKFSFYLQYYLPMVIIFLFMWKYLKDHSKIKILLTSLLIFIMPINIGLDINQTREYTTSATWMNYGETGIKETVEYLRPRLSPKLISIIRKDIEYYINYRYDLDIPDYPPGKVFKMNDETLDKFFQTVPIQYFVFDRISSFQRLRESSLNIINKYFVEDARIGDFIILKNRKLVER